MSILYEHAGERNSPLTSSRKLLAALALILVATAAAGAGFAADSGKHFKANRVTVPSGKSYEQVNEAIKSLVAQNGMMIMAQVNQGEMLAMTGLELKATLYLVGNPTVGKQLFEQDHAVGLYVPLRLSVYSDAGGKTYIEYDQPSSLLEQFSNPKVTETAGMLDKKLEGLAMMAAK